MNGFIYFQIQLYLSLLVQPCLKTLKMKADQESVRNLLTDTVILLCKNDLQYQTELRVQGVLGITLDNNDVFIVHINEKFGGDIGGTISIRTDEGDAAKTLLSGVRVDTKQSRGESETPVAGNTTTGAVVHKRRRRSRESSTSPAFPTNSSQQQTLQRPIKTPSSGEYSPSGVKHTSFLNSTDNYRLAEPVSDDIVDVKVKIEDDDDVIIIGQNHDNRTETSVASHGISNPADESAIMQDSYPNLTIGEIQGSYQHFGEVFSVSNSSTKSGLDGTAPPPLKRCATSGSTHDSFGGSSEMGPGGGGPFITGIMRNEIISGDVASQTASAAAWDPSEMPDFGSLTAQDSHVILDSAPGCSTWDTTQQSQVLAVRKPTMQSVFNTADQSSESVGVPLFVMGVSLHHEEITYTFCIQFLHNMYCYKV